MTSIDELVRNNPDKTCREILEIQRQEEIDDEQAITKRNAKKVELINDINTNGGYYKGVFSLTQYYYYRFFNLRLMEGSIICDAEKIIMFYNEEHTHCTTRIGETQIERRIEKFQEFENYGVGMCERVTVEEWLKVCDQIDNIIKQNFEVTKYK